MKRREFITLLGGATAAWPLTASGQQTERVRRIGYLSPRASEPLSPVISAFFGALFELGWIEGKNVIVERRFAENRLDQLPELAADLVRLNVEVIVAEGTLGPLAAKAATSNIPVVMTAAGDPLGTGLVASLGRPGSNVTGMSLMAPELGGKRLELLKELLPQFARVAVIWNAANPYPAIVFKETLAAGQILGVEVQSLEVRNPGDFGSAFESIIKQRPDALIIIDDPLTVDHQERITRFAAAQQLPALFGAREFVASGGLISYGTNPADSFRRAASYVDKILKGTKPADLPVQQPTKFELVINAQTARMLGLTVPPSLLARADEVIE
jgi:putative ABC transport system substrate-binding protein